MPNSNSLLLLDKNDVESLLDPGDVLQAVREAFVLHSQSEGRTFPVVREQLATGGVFGVKSGELPSHAVLGLKAAGFFPENHLHGQGRHQATIMLIDPATGRPKCVIDGNAITTMRTGAAGALGLVRLARPDSSRVCVFGTGVQARIHLDFALRMMPTLNNVSYVTSDGLARPDFEALFRNRCEVELAVDPDDTVACSDVIITATLGGGALFDRGAVRPGTHLNCVGADTKGKRELPEALLASVRLFVDDWEQARRIGEAQWAPDTPWIELGDLLTRRAHYNRSPTDITVFDMTGLALQDLTVARLIHKRAESRGAGTMVAWPW